MAVNQSHAHAPRRLWHSAVAVAAVVIGVRLLSWASASFFVLPSLRTSPLKRSQRAWQTVQLRSVATDVDDAALSIASKDYWDQRYKMRDSFGKAEHIDDRGMGWYCEYQGPLRQTLQAIANGRRDARILNIGCGVDRLAADIYFDGFTNILSTDIAPAAIDEMSATSAMSMPDAEWMVDDVMNMQVPSASVDVVVDKGTLDAVMLGSTLFTNAAKMLREVQRVLKVGGTYLIVTHGRGDAKATRVPLLQLPHLSFNVQVTPDMGGHFLLVCTKLPSLLEEAEEAARWKEVQDWAAQRDSEDSALEAANMDGTAAPAGVAPARPEEVPTPAAPSAPAPPDPPQAAPNVEEDAPRAVAQPVGETEEEDSGARRRAEQEAEWDRIDEIGQ